jgi:uncharacterized membrane protein
MELQIILGFLSILLPISGLRVGLPLLVEYSLRNNILLLAPFFMLSIFLSILVVVLLYFFLDLFHKYLLKWNFYSKVYHKFIEKMQKKHQKFEKKFNDIGYWALFIYVALPIPGTGAWAGTLFAWLLGLDKRKALVAISLGLLASGIIILALTLGIIGTYNFLR